jgi:hypothetical protein
MDDKAKSVTTLKKGDKIKENRQGARTETVLSQTENVVETYEGNRYHITKIVRAGSGAADHM